MNEAAHVPALTTLVDRAVVALSSARTSAEVLEARDLAGVAYDVAKATARFASAKGAYDSLLAAAHRAQADALEIEVGAKRRIADEYDAAQERGEVKSVGNPNYSQAEKLPSASEIGLTPKEIHEARTIRDAEEADPGIVRRVVEEAIASNQEPTRAKVMRAVKATRCKPAKRRKRKPATPLASEPMQGACADCDTPEAHWQRSASNLAGDAISMRAYWTREFGDWEKFEVPASLVVVAKQAAQAWAQLSKELAKR